MLKSISAKSKCLGQTVHVCSLQSKKQPWLLNWIFLLLLLVIFLFYGLMLSKDCWLCLVTCAPTWTCTITAVINRNNWLQSPLYFSRLMSLNHNSPDVSFPQCSQCFSFGCSQYPQRNTWVVLIIGQKKDSFGALGTN